MDNTSLLSYLHEVTLRQDKTNRLLVAIAKRLDRNQASLRRMIAQQTRAFNGPLDMMDEYGDDLSYDEVIAADRAAPQPTPVQQRPYEGVTRQESDADGTNYFRHELPGRRWLIVMTDPEMRVNSVRLEFPDGHSETLTPEQALLSFGDLPFFNLVTDDRVPGAHPTDVPLNPDVEVDP